MCLVFHQFNVIRPFCSLKTSFPGLLFVGPVHLPFILSTSVVECLYIVKITIPYIFFFFFFCYPLFFSSIVVDYPKIILHFYTDKYLFRRHSHHCRLHHLLRHFVLRHFALHHLVVHCFPKSKFFQTIILVSW